MKLVIQRARKARVECHHQTVGSIGLGMVVFVAIEHGDDDLTINKAIQKLLKLRIFSSDSGKMNLSVQDVSGGILFISQFTLTANLHKGHRPSFHTGIDPIEARQIYNRLLEFMQRLHPCVEQGVFAADMLVTVENDGPATFLLTF